MRVRGLAAAAALGAGFALAQAPAKPEDFIVLKGALTALTHVELHDGTGAPPLADATIVIRDGRIAAAGPAASVKIPEGAEVHDLAGHSVTPGFVMLHEHMFYPVAPAAYGAMFDTFPKLYL